MGREGGRVKISLHLRLEEQRGSRASFEVCPFDAQEALHVHFRFLYVEITSSVFELQQLV